ncbi:MAG: ABC transporter permease [Chloroflexi bacterium]|nr:ABC transporter permease [Chloroflexota bacterium]
MIFPQTCYEGLFYALIAIGVYITFRVLAFPDLSVDGTFPLGGAVAAVLISDHAMNPFIATMAAFGAGVCAGFVTGILNTKLRISALLSGILVMIGLYSINLRIMDGSQVGLLWDRTVQDVIGDWFGLNGMDLLIVTYLMALLVVFCILNWFLRTDLGLALRATGDNEQMMRSLGTDTDKTVILGCALSNGLVAMAGALLAQQQGGSQVGMGIGIIVYGLAMVLVGESLIRKRGITWILTACLVGAFVYRFLIVVALRTDWVDTGDIKLLTAVLVIIVLVIPLIQKKIRGEWIPPASRM